MSADVYAPTVTSMLFAALFNRFASRQDIFDYTGWRGSAGGYTYTMCSLDFVNRQIIGCLNKHAPAILGADMKQLCRI
jgi:hypothetical protein